LSVNPAGVCVETQTADEEQHWAASMLLTPVLEPCVRVWTCARPAVVLGRAQRPDKYMALRAKADGIELCRRATGGGAVLAGPPPWTLLCDVMGMWRGFVMMLSRRTASCTQFLGKPPSTTVLAVSLLRALLTPAALAASVVGGIAGRLRRRPPGPEPA